MIYESYNIIYHIINIKDGGFYAIINNQSFKKNFEIYFDIIFITELNGV